MATITSTPTGGTLTVNKSKEVKGTISWSKPTVPSGATISSCVLTGKATATMSKGSVTITVNGTSVTSGSTFTINLGTDNSATSVTTSIKGANNQASGSVSFSELLYTVTYTEPVAKPTYTVTFKDWDGTTLKTQTVEEGSSATAPSNPTRYGYTFTGWDKTFTNITGDITVTAQYEIDRGGLTSNTTTLAIEYGVEKNLIINVDTLKISTSLSSIKIKNSQGDSSKTNTIFDWRLKGYSSSQNTVTFGITGTKNGTEIITVYDPNGNAELHITITVSGAPEEEPDVELVPVQKSATLRADNVTEDSSYNNKWTDLQNINDENASTYGTLIVTGTGQGGFVKDTVTTIFDIDNNIPANATINNATLTVRTKSSATTNLYMSVDVNNDSSKRVMNEQLMDSTSAKNYTVDITDYAKELDTIALTYRTAGSSSRTATVYDIRADVDYTVYEEVPDDPEEPETPEVPEIPEGAVPVDYSIALRPISATQDSGYNNSWTNIANAYDTDTSTSGTIIVTGSSQSGFKRKYVDTLFNFDNPIPANATINSAVLTIRAKQSSTTNLNIVASIGNNEVIGSTLLSNSAANYTADIANYIKNLSSLNINLTSAATSNRTFTLYDVRIDVNYTAYEMPKPTYTVVFQDWDGFVLKTQKVEEGSSATAPSNPTRAGYIFIGWDVAFDNITSDLTVTAQYEIQIQEEPETPKTSYFRLGDILIDIMYLGGDKIEAIFIGENKIF